MWISRIQKKVAFCVCKSDGIGGGATESSQHGIECKTRSPQKSIAEDRKPKVSSAPNKLILSVTVQTTEASNLVKTRTKLKPRDPHGNGEFLTGFAAAKTGKWLGEFSEERGH